MADSSDGYKIVSDNRQARHEYEILETYEAGLELMGSEVKSIRQGKVSLRDGYARGTVAAQCAHFSLHDDQQSL